MALKKIILPLSCLSLVGLIFSACPKMPPEGGKPTVTYPDHRKSTTPEATAAKDLVDEGRSLMKSESYDQAEWKFQQAARLAPSYGVPYYWLSKVKYEEKEYQRSYNYLRRAEMLLGHLPEWQDDIAGMKGKIVEAANRE